MTKDEEKTRAQLIEELIELRKKYALDITDRKRAEQALQKSEERLIAAGKAAYDLIYEWNVVDDTLEWFGDIDGLLGFEHGEISRDIRAWLNLIHPEDSGQLENAVELHRTLKEPIQYEYRVRHKDGTYRTWNDHGLPLLDDKDTPYKWVGVCTDITDRKRAEEALKKSEEQLRLLIENMGDMVSRHLADSTITYVSPSCESLLGYKPEDLINTRSGKFVHPDDVEETMAVINNAASQHDEHYRLEHRLRHKDGKYIWVETVGRLVYGPDDNLCEIQCTARDINQRKQAEEEKLALERQVQQAQKLESLGVLAGGIAHDFNNLLVGVLGNADLALLDMSPESPARGRILDIEVAAKRAADLTKQMLAYSGKGKFIVNYIDLQSLIEETVHLLDVSISKKVVIRYDFAESVPPIEADATQIRQILMNLVVNASEAIGNKSGVVSIRTGAMDCDQAYLDETCLDNDLPEGTYSYLEVSDTGSGIDDDTVPKIFDPFFTTKFTGRGLGLAAVLGIVRGHKGAIKVYSEPGKGTTFKALFPASQDSAFSPDILVSSKIEAKFENKTILLVDDEETVRAVGRQMLEHLGIEVTTAADGREALELFKQDPDRYDCIILDLTMPHMDGEETFREMRRVRGDILVVLSSGYNEQDLIARFAGKGLAGFIQKPFQTAGIGAVLAKVFETSGR